MFNLYCWYGKRCRSYVLISLHILTCSSFVSDISKCVQIDPFCSCLNDFIIFSLPHEEISLHMLDEETLLCEGDVSDGSELSQ